MIRFQSHLTEPQVEYLEDKSAELGFDKPELMRRIIDYYRERFPVPVKDEPK
jgi:hypothetical protein